MYYIICNIYIQGGSEVRLQLTLRHFTFIRHSYLLALYIINTYIVKKMKKYIIVTSDSEVTVTYVWPNLHMIYIT